jgi:uncharacterized membrane protein
MNANKVFRANARKQLGGGIFENTWLMVLVACLIHSLILGVSSIVAIIVGGFLTYGLYHIILQLVRGQKEKVDLADLFSGSEHFSDLLVLYLLQTLFTILWTLLFIIPGIVKSYAYSMAFYIKHDHPDYDWRRCLDESQRYMKGYKWQLFCLDFSFIGWMLLGLLCCGVGLLWVIPYQATAHANFYENLRAIYEPEDTIPHTEGDAAEAQADAPEYFDVNEQ